MKGTVRYICSSTVRTGNFPLGLHESYCIHLHQLHLPSLNPSSLSNMSFLFGGRPQLSSAEKIAAAELEVEMVSDMLQRYFFLLFFIPRLPDPLSTSCLLLQFSPSPFHNRLYKKSSSQKIQFHRLTQSCSKKCIPPDYRESDLNKGESVCLDRCVAKFFDVNSKVSEKMQADAALRQGAASGAGSFGT